MIKDLLKEGFVLKSKGYYKHAIETFYKALAIDNTSPELLLEIADLYYILGEQERALSYVEQALDQNPMHIQSLKLLKKFFIDKKQWQKAEKTAQNIYKISNNESDFAEILELLNKQQKYNEVINSEIPVKTPNILYELAFAKLFNNNPEEALTDINLALNFDSENLKNLLLKSKILFKLDRLEECDKLVEKFDRNTTSADMLNFRGLVKQYLGEYNEALACFIEATKLESQNDEYYYNCASTCFKMDKINEAKKYYNIAISLNSDNPNYHFALANLYYSEKHYKRALEELQYDFFEAKLLKSIILYDTGYLAIAKKEILKLAKERPNDPMVIEYKKRIEDELKI